MEGACNMVRSVILLKKEKSWVGERERKGENKGGFQGAGGAQAGACPLPFLWKLRNSDAFANVIAL